ncbi:MAG TPA: DUF4282 domain-containing protein [Bacteroidales bacterium]|nr:DUF4282 domain-containing protein [Bacteroidales bacterium]
MDNDQEQSTINDFFSFRKFISLIFIQVIYLLGAIAITIAGIVFLVKSEGDLGFFILQGLGLLIIGNLAWRLICEVWILFFRLASSLSNIENQIKTLSSNSLNQVGNKASYHNDESIFCPVCGHKQTDKTAEFCEECGSKL